MAILKDGEIVHNPVEVVALDIWLVHQDTRKGVILDPDQPPRIIEDVLDKLPAVAVSFPVFSDGRGFTYGRQLREEYGYKGEIRAVGHLIRDQYQFLHRCGFDSIEVKDDTAIDEWKIAMNEITLFYQNTVDLRQPVSVLRRWIRAAE